MTAPTVRPEWAAVATHAALLDLAAALALEAERHVYRLADELRTASTATRACATHVASGRYDTDTALAWLDAGRAQLKEALR